MLPGSDAEILLIPLIGHTHGHTGVAVRRGGDWLLHCGDAFFHHGEVATPPHCPRATAAFAALDEVDSDGPSRQRRAPARARRAPRRARSS